MLIQLAVFAVISLALLAWLSHAIRRVAKALGACPDMAQGTRAGLEAAALSISTGFLAIGAGGLFVIAGAMAAVDAPAPVALMSALGLGVLCLGLGFTHAVTLLRGLMVAQAPEPKTPWQAAKPQTPKAPDPAQVPA